MSKLYVICTQSYREFVADLKSFIQLHHFAWLYTTQESINSLSETPMSNINGISIIIILLASIWKEYNLAYIILISEITLTQENSRNLWLGLAVSKCKQCMVNQITAKQTEKIIHIIL